MDLKKVADELQHVIETSGDFLRKNEDELVDFMRKKEMSAEENLQKEILLELLDHIYGIRHLSQYMGSDVTQTGILEQNEDGEILLNGEILPLMTELEVLIYDEIEEKDVWSRTYIGGAEKRYLVGLGKNRDICGLPARIRI